jgi:hypothetical protein
MNQNVLIERGNYLHNYFGMNEFFKSRKTLLYCFVVLVSI